MSLELAINNALTGLNVNQAALGVVSQNLANANTEGYTKKTIEQSDINIRNTRQIGAGVRIDDVVRKVDKYLQRTTRTQTSASASSSTIDDYMERIQVMLGQPGDVNSIDEYIETYFNQLQSLADTPERIAAREAAVDSGEILARELVQLATGLEDLRLQADQDYSASIRSLNGFLTELDNINVAISNATALGNPISSLQDEQDRIIKDITEIVDVETLVQDDNEIYLYTANGVALLDSAAYEVVYNQVHNIEHFVDSTPVAPTLVYRLDDDGNRLPDFETLVTAGNEGDVTTGIESGNMAAHLELRDSVIPAVLQQLDQLSAVVRDSVNAVHNNGSSYPGTNELTGTRSVQARDVYDWEGELRIAVLDKNGEPVPAPYQNEAHTGFRPLTLDLEELQSGTGKGHPDIQTIIDEINNHFQPPTAKVEIANLNNIELVSLTDSFPDATPPPLLEFDFDLENISGLDADVFITDIQVLDDTAANITSVTNTAPSIPINLVNGFATTNGSNTVTINASNHGLADGDIVFVPDPGAPVNGIPNGEFGRYFEVSNATAGGFDIIVGMPATATGGVGGGGLSLTPEYDTILPGEKRRTNEQGTFTADVSANTTSTYYDIQVSVGVYNSDLPSADDVQTAIVTYRIPNFGQDLRNDRFDHTSVTGQGTRNLVGDSNPLMSAILVDENGVELQKSNGKYVDAPSFLKLVTTDSDHTVAIDELTSKQKGITSTSPTAEGTDRGFSHFFELNNFFQSNESTATGDTVKNSAINMAVEQRFIDNANLISLGNLELSNQSADPNDPPIYTYQRNAGANTAIQELAELSISIQEFDEAGGLASSRQTYNGYVGEVLAFLASAASTAELNADDDRILLDGFAQRLDQATGVNVDEELANTVIYQNAYNASARVLSVANEMFDALLDAVN